MKNSLAFILTVFVFILNSGTISNIVLSILVLLLFAVNFKSVKMYMTYKLLIFCGMIFSILVGTILLEEVDFQRLLILLLILFSFPYEIYFSENSYKVLIGIAIYLFILQIGTGLGIGPISSYVSSFYPIDDNIWKYGDIERLSDFKNNRFGGVFYNPNIMGQSMLLLYGVIVKYILDNSKIRNSILIFSLFVVSITLTGSRTAMVTFIILNFFIFRKYITAKSLIFIILPILFFFVYSIDLESLVDSFRVLNFDLYGSKGSSGNVKISILINWLNEVLLDHNFNFLKILFGIGAIPTQFDFDIGYMIQMLGFFGFTLFILFFRKIFKDTVVKYRFVFLLFLISIGATIIVNFRFSILIFIILSIHNKKGKQVL